MTHEKEIQLKDRVALVTGVGGEIGSATAMRFAREGARLAVCESSFATAERVKDVIKEKKGKALPFEADLLDRPQVDDMVEKIVNKWGNIDILVNIIEMRQDDNFLNMETSTWKNICEAYLVGCFNITQSVVRHMAVSHYGRIINFSAPNDTRLIVRNERSNYLSATTGIEGMTVSLANELGKYGITANCIVPEFIDTEMLRKSARPEGLYRDDLIKIAASLVPLGRLGTPEEVANVAHFLASDEASYVNGQIIRVKGGP